MKKVLLLAGFCVLLTGCSSHKVYSINTDKATAGKLLESFAITNGFTVPKIDLEAGIVRIETEDLKLKGGFYGGVEQSHPTGFGVRLRETSPKCTALYTDSFGLGLRGYTYNKRKRFLKQAREEGFIIYSGNSCSEAL
jgi:hypothetical protein